ncbi:MAG: diadenylate cyclase CdaA [Planctomycetota bacterium]
MRVLAWVLQVLILTAGIHLFLRFVRTTRGNRLIRGLFITVLGGVVGLWGLSDVLHLEELRHLLEVSTGFIVVTLAIVFQPELRRGIAQIGERSILGRLIKSSGLDTVSRVVRAAHAMASRRVGALIAFERETSLHNYIEEGTPLDSAVNARLIESIFHPGNALHDGAVIVRRDRIAAAGCFFPLPQEADIDASMGTRHRAAIGLSEDTDAVVLVVSEETGRISVARQGRIASTIAPDRIEDELRAMLAGRESALDLVRRRVVPASFAAWRRDLLWLLGSVIFACGVLYVAHRDILETHTFRVRVVAQNPSEQRPPRDGEIRVILPREDQVLVAPATDASYYVVVAGSRGQVGKLGPALRGALEIGSTAWSGGVLDLGQVQWDDAVPGLTYRWQDEEAPTLVVEEVATTIVPLDVADVQVDALDLDPRYEVRPAGIRFAPAAALEVRGPTSLLRKLDTAELPLTLAPIALTPQDRMTISRRLRLSSELSAARLSLVGDPPVEVILPIGPRSREVDTIAKEIAVACLDPSLAGELDRWRLPAAVQVARFTIETAGLVPVDADSASPAIVERYGLIRRFVEENLMVFVDLSDLPPAGEGHTVPVRWTWRKDWRSHAESLSLDPANLGEDARLDVRLDSDAEVLLEERSAPAEVDR